MTPVEYDALRLKWRAARDATEARLLAEPRTYRRAIRYWPPSVTHRIESVGGDSIRLSFRAPGGALVVCIGGYREVYLRAARAARLLFGVKR